MNMKKKSLSLNRKREKRGMRQKNWENMKTRLQGHEKNRDKKNETENNMLGLPSQGWLGSPNIFSVSFLNMAYEMIPFPTHVAKSID